ncbi:MAG TPA: hypothetical protein VGO93_09855 [Candidatus Xenobia bacterium]|jgi:hypothetical protein
MSEPQPLLRGTWGEVIRRQDAIPGTQRVVVMADVTPTSEPDPDDPEQVRLQGILDAYLDEAETTTFNPPEGPLPLATQAVVDKFRRKGLAT